MSLDDVYLARHGRTVWNEQKRWQGQWDSPLTAAGRQAAADLARIAGELEIEVVFTSPLPRARDTAAVTAEALGIEMYVLPELAEMHHGEMAGLTAREADARFPGARESRALDKYNWRFPGGESYADTDERVTRALQEVRRSPVARPLVVSHEMIGRMLLRRLAGLAPDEVLGRAQPHRLVYRVVPSLGEIDELYTDRTDSMPPERSRS